MRLRDLNYHALKGQLLDYIQDALEGGDPSSVNFTCRAVDTAAKVSGLYIHNALSTESEPVATGAFKIAPAWTDAEEAAIRAHAGQPNALAYDPNPDWTLNETARPYALQARIFDAVINSNALTVVLAIGRQFGKTWVGAMSALYWALNFPGSEIHWVVPLDAHAKKIARDFDRYLAGYRGKYQVIHSSGDQAVYFKDIGSSIHIRQVGVGGGTERGAQNKGLGKRGNTADYLIIDEAAFIDGGAIEKAVMPLALVKCRRKLIMSTPCGYNWFREAFLDGQRPEARTISFTATAADNPFIPQEHIEAARRATSELSFRQEYLAEFVEDGGSVFTGINAALMDSYAVQADGPLYVGVDYGKSLDYTVVTVLNAAGQMVDLERFQGADWPSINARVAAMLTRYGWPAGYVETNGVGAVADYLFEHESNTTRQLWGFTTNAKTKARAIQELQIDLANGDVRIWNDETLLTELRMFTFKVLENGVRYGARDGYHDDCVMSLALANQARRDLGG